MTRAALVLVVAGLSATVCSQLGAAGDLALFGVEGEMSGPLGLGPDWVMRVPDVAGGLGLSAAVYGVISWRRRDRAVAAIVAISLAVGTAFVIWWLAAPPSALLDGEGDAFAYSWWLWAAAGALVVAVAAATALSRRSVPPSRSRSNGRAGRGPRS